MRAKRKNEFGGKWGLPKQELAQHEAHKNPRKKSGKKPKLCKLSKQPHQELPTPSLDHPQLDSIRVYKCKCGKKMRMEYMCRHCKNWNEKWALDCDTCNKKRFQKYEK